MQFLNASSAGSLTMVFAWFAVCASYARGQVATEADRQIGEQRAMLEFQQRAFADMADLQAGAPLAGQQMRFNKAVHAEMGEEERQPKSDTDREFEKLLGTWIGVAYEQDGLPRQPFQEPDFARFVFKRAQTANGGWKSTLDHRMQLNKKKPSGVIHKELPGLEYKMWDVDLRRTPMEFWESDLVTTWKPPRFEPLPRFPKALNDPLLVEASWWRVANFQLDGDQMVWCFPGTREPTPAEAREGKLSIVVFPREGEKLTTAPGDGRLLVHFERQKDPEAEKHAIEAAEPEAILQGHQPKTMATKKPRPIKKRISPPSPK